MYPSLLLLLYMNPVIGLNYSMQTENCCVFNSTAAIKSGNRVYHSSLPSDQEVEAIKEYFGSMPFTWGVYAADTACIRLLEKHGLSHKITVKVMTLDLDVMGEQTVKEGIEVIEASFSERDLALWAHIVAKVFNTGNEEELLKFTTVLTQHITPPHLKLYVGYYHGKAVAASMAIIHGEMVSLHWVGTLPEFRNKGLGSLVMYKALQDVRLFGCKQAILMATALGRPLSERLGFRECGECCIYGNY